MSIDQIPELRLLMYEVDVLFDNLHYGLRWLSQKHSCLGPTHRKWFIASMRCVAFGKGRHQ